MLSTEGKTDCKYWNTDSWGGYERVLGEEYKHYMGKDRTQRLERTNGIVRQQTSRWHRRQNKFGKVWEQTEITTRLVVSYFNWMVKYSMGNNRSNEGRIKLKAMELERAC